MGEICGSTAVTLRCQLPEEDLDTLVSITSDEDLANLIEEYERVAATPPSSLKVRAFLSLPKSTKKPISPSSSSGSSSKSSSSSTPRFSCIRHQIPAGSAPVVFPSCSEKSASKNTIPYYGHHVPHNGNLDHIGLNGNHWQ